MLLDSKPLDAITEADLLSLIEDKVAEQQTIDYKKALILEGDVSRDEFRRDVTSFANSVGGHLVIGMNELNGLPTDLCGQAIPNPDAFKLRINDLLQTKISPRIPGVGINVNQLTNGNQAVVIRIPRSFAKPHEITIGKDDFQFWARNAAGKYRLKVDELRSVMLQSESVAERIRQFRTERVGNVISGDTPVKMVTGAKLALHMVPLDAFDASARYDLSKLARSEYAKFRVTLAGEPSGTTAKDFRHNAEGFLSYFETHYSGGIAESYWQLFRNGVLEIVDASHLSLRKNELHPRWRIGSEKALIASLQRGIEFQSLLGVDSPTVIMLSITGATNCEIFTLNHMSNSMQVPFGRDELLLPDIVIERPLADAGAALRPIFDAIWNAGGNPACPYYDDATGKYRD